LEVWEKVHISDEAFVESVHGLQGCITCHGGASGANEKEAAHEGVVREPDSAEACGPCHAEIVATDANSLHTPVSPDT
jgi:hypothetical protein